MKEVFDRIHSKYDVINDLITFGTVRFFKWLLFNRVPKGEVCLDLASGTGDNLRYIGDKFRKIVCVDPSRNMLEHIAKRHNGYNVSLLERTAEENLNLTVDCVIVTFGFRNFANPEVALRHISTYLTSGGKLFVMDVFKPSNQFISLFLTLHFKWWVIPIGGLISGDPSAYKYFKESVFSFFTLAQFVELVECYKFKKTWSLSVLGLAMCEFTKL